MKKSQRILIRLLAPWVAGLVLVCGLATSMFSGGRGDDRAGVSVSAPTLAPRVSGYTVVYEVTSDSNDLSITFTNADGDTAQRKVSSYDGWRQEQVMQRGVFAYVSAQMTYTGGRKVSCRILVDGVVVRENTSTGQYSIVTCSGRL